jgi:hypothetical protein
VYHRNVLESQELRALRQPNESVEGLYQSIRLAFPVAGEIGK